MKKTLRLISPVVSQDGSHNIPPHSTGGAIDIYLVDAQDNDGSVSLIGAKTISPEAQKKP